MTVPAAVDPQFEHTRELLRAARVLLERRIDLDAIQILHVEIARQLSSTQTSSQSPSWAEARRRQQELLLDWEQHDPGLRRLGTLRHFLRRARAWLWLAVAAAALVGLTTRYLWRVTYGMDWNQQNPEGNWVSRFYSNDSFAGYPVVRYDIGVNADFGSGAPADAMKKDSFSARWDTCLVASKDIVLPLELTSDDSSRLFVDEQVQSEVTPGPGKNAAIVSLHPGTHHVRVDFVERTGMAMVRLDGLELYGSEAYALRRPVIDADDVRCR